MLMSDMFLSIDKIGLSNRAANVLHRANCHTLGDVLKLTETDLRGIKNLGSKTVDEILMIQKKYGNVDASEKSMVLSGDEEGKIVNTNDNPEIDVLILEGEKREIAIECMKNMHISTESIELLPARIYNLLVIAGYTLLYQLAYVSESELLANTGLNEEEVSLVVKIVNLEIQKYQKEISFAVATSNKENDEIFPSSLYEAINESMYRNKVLSFVKMNDRSIANSMLSQRTKSRLMASGYDNLSDILFLEREELQKIKSMGAKSVSEVVQYRDAYISENEARIMAFLGGEEDSLIGDDTIRDMVLHQFQELKFGGLSLAEMSDRINSKVMVDPDRLKSVLGKLLSEKELEYVDFRCYRVYDRFEDVLKECMDIDERNRELVYRRLQGMTLDAIGKECGLTRERVRQIVKKEVQKVQNYYFERKNKRLFDEDYYRYLYETYDFEKSVGTEWLGVPASVAPYFELNDVKRGKKKLNTALEDVKGLDAGMRLKIKNYLNRNKLFIDGRWVDKKRSELERVAVRKFCSDNVSFEEFVQIYNRFLEQEEIPFDEKIYCTDAVKPTRRNRMSEERYLLWKLNEQIRYYEIDARDYTELFDELNLDSFENVEISTLKLVREHPDIMEKYDVRDHYELHNLLRKVVPEGAFHDFHCGRMPMIRFGEFDRDAAILSLLQDNAPISINDLAEVISEEYGYDPAVIMSNYLQPLDVYYHNGMYVLDQKEMTEENRLNLLAALTDDFYFIDEIRNVYAGLIPEADTEEVNPYNLKKMGFRVYPRYVFRHYDSIDAYFNDILTREDVTDITSYRRKFCYVGSFSQTLMILKRSLQVIEFEPNQVIHFRKLQQAGVTREMIRDFCQGVYEFVEDGAYFSLQSIKKDGFSSELFDLGFSDWFYANLLISDSRFKFSSMMGNLIFHKGREIVTLQSFLLNLIREYGCIDVYDLMTELTDRYSCKVSDRWDVLEKVKNTEAYHDKVLDRLYANVDLYYRDLEGGF